MNNLTLPKRLALFVLWPVVAAVLFAGVVLVLIAAWPFILTPWFNQGHKGE